MAAELAADVAVIVVAAGSGVRLGAGVPKALHPLGDSTLLGAALPRASRAAGVGCVVIAAPPAHLAQVRDLVDRQRDAPEIVVVPGGAERRDSVAAALAAVPVGLDLVLVHDAARTLAPSSLFERVAQALRAGHDAVIPTLPLVDTIKRVDGLGVVESTLDRSQLRAIQTPQGFRRSVLLAAHAATTDAEVNDDASLVESLGVPVHTVPGDPLAFKITTPWDLALAERLVVSA